MSEKKVTQQMVDERLERLEEERKQKAAKRERENAKRLWIAEGGDPAAFDREYASWQDDAAAIVFGMPRKKLAQQCEPLE